MLTFLCEFSFSPKLLTFLPSPKGYVYDFSGIVSFFLEMYHCPGHNIYIYLCITVEFK